MRFSSSRKRARRGQALVEYAIVVAGVALVGLAAVTLLGHKTGHMLEVTTVVLPGAHSDDNGPMFAAQLVETTDSANGAIGLDVNAIMSDSGTGRLTAQLFDNGDLGSQMLRETSP